MSFIDLTKNDIWSDADIENRVRSVTNAQVSPARQSELQTIMLGHISQIRTATDAELVEIMQVKDLIEVGAVNAAAARADMALLNEVLAYEADNTIPISEAGQALYALRNPPAPEPIEP